MPAYDAKQFDPPAPVASVVIRSRQSGVTFSGLPAGKMAHLIKK